MLEEIRVNKGRAKTRLIQSLQPRQWLLMLLGTRGDGQWRDPGGIWQEACSRSHRAEPGAVSSSGGDEGEFFLIGESCFFPVQG